MQDKTYFTLSKVVKRKITPFFLGGPPPTVSNNYVVAGQWLLIDAACVNHSAANMASVGITTTTMKMK
jgi:hypothetical protein